MHTKEKVCTQKTSKKVIKNNSKDSKEPIEPDAKDVLENTELTDKQRLFCIYYIKCFNATKAYQKAYQCDYITAKSNGYRLLTNAYIKQKIERLHKIVESTIFVSGIL